MNRELDVGFSYKMDAKDTFQYNQSYDLNNNRLFDQDYTWIRDFHCWTGTFTYRAKRNQWKWDFALKRW